MESHAWTESNTHQNRSCFEASLVGRDQWTTQEPFGRLIPPQLEGNCGAAVGHDADR
jgi:hypothetical protein